MTELKKHDQYWQHFLFWSGFEPETPKTQNDRKVQVDCEKIEKKTRGKNSRGHNRKVEQGNNQPENESNVNDKPISEPLQNKAQRKCSLNYKMK